MKFILNQRGQPEQAVDTVAPPGARPRTVDQLPALFAAHNLHLSESELPGASVESARGGSPPGRLGVARSVHGPSANSQQYVPISEQSTALTSSRTGSIEAYRGAPGGAPAHAVVVLGATRMPM